MKLTTLSSTELGMIIGAAAAVVGLIIVAFVAWQLLRKRRTEKLRTQFGGAEYDRTVKEDGSRRHAEAGLKERNERVESLAIRHSVPVIGLAS